ncbi:hypothetical protein NFI96_024917, partial [Prochilodus magdalenae]
MLWGDDPNLCGPERTMETYSSAVDHLQTKETPDVEGVKFNRPITAADWADSFQIPWVRWPEALMQGLERGKGQAHSYLGDLLKMGLSAELVYGSTRAEDTALRSPCAQSQSMEEKLFPTLTTWGLPV